MSYLFDNRKPEEVKQDLERGKRDEKLYMQRVSEYTKRYPEALGYQIVKYLPLGEDEHFYADGVGRPYKPDFLIAVKGGNRKGTRFYNVEMKTSSYEMPSPGKDYLFCKKNQIDKLTERYKDRGVVIFADPWKFAIVNALRIKHLSFLSEEEEYGDKEAYKLHTRFIKWIFY